MNLLWTKVISLCVLGVGTFLSGLISLPLSKKVLSNPTGVAGRTQALIASLLSCFGGGVLLATTMLHMMPEVTESLAVEAEKIELESLSQLVVCSGFFLIYLVEEVVEALVGGYKETTETLKRTFSVRRTEQRTGGCGEKEDCHNDMEVGRQTQNTNTSSSDQLIVGNPSKTGSLREFFTILALSVHSVFEGLAVGLEESTSDVWKLLLAIACHKFVISFCVCLDMLQSGTRTTIFYTYLTIFSLVSCLGIGIGIAISEAGSESVPEVVVATLQGMAAGTLLYVVMFEVLNREREKEVHGMLQLTAVMVGFTLMLILEIFIHHEHHHEEEHQDEGHQVEEILVKPATTAVLNVLGF